MSEKESDARFGGSRMDDTPVKMMVSMESEARERPPHPSAKPATPTKEVDLSVRASESSLEDSYSAERTHNTDLSLAQEYAVDASPGNGTRRDEAAESAAKIQRLHRDHVRKTNIRREWKRVNVVARVNAPSKGRTCFASADSKGRVTLPLGRGQRERFQFDMVLDKDVSAQASFDAVVPHLVQQSMDMKPSTLLVMGDGGGTEWTVGHSVLLDITPDMGDLGEGEGGGEGRHDDGGDDGAGRRVSKSALRHTVSHLLTRMAAIRKAEAQGQLPAGSQVPQTLLFSAFEIYNNSVYDLQSKQKCALYDDRVQDLMAEPIESIDAFDDVLHLCMFNSRTRNTVPRSHLFFRFAIQWTSSEARADSAGLSSSSTPRSTAKAASTRRATKDVEQLASPRASLQRRGSFTASHLRQSYETLPSAKNLGVDVSALSGIEAEEELQQQQQQQQKQQQKQKKTGNKASGTKSTINVHTSVLTVVLVAPIAQLDGSNMGKAEHALKGSIMNLGLMIENLTGKSDSSGFHWRTFKLTQLLCDAFTNPEARLTMVAHTRGLKNELQAAIAVMSLVSSAGELPELDEGGVDGSSSSSSLSTSSKAKRRGSQDDILHTPGELAKKYQRAEQRCAVLGVINNELVRERDQLLQVLQGFVNHSSDESPMLAEQMYAALEEAGVDTRVARDMAGLNRSHWATFDRDKAKFRRGGSNDDAEGSMSRSSSRRSSTESDTNSSLLSPRSTAGGGSLATKRALVKNKQEHKRTVAELQSKYEEMKSGLEEQVAAEKSRAKREARQLRSMYSKEKEMNNKLREQLEEAEKTLEAKRKEMVKMEEAMKQLRSDTDRKLKLLEKQVAEKAEASRNKLKEQTVQFQQQNVKLQSLQAQVADLMKANSDTKAENERLKKEKSSLEAAQASALEEEVEKRMQLQQMIEDADEASRRAQNVLESDAQEDEEEEALLAMIRSLVRQQGMELVELDKRIRQFEDKKEEGGAEVRTHPVLSAQDTRLLEYLGSWKETLVAHRMQIHDEFQELRAYIETTLPHVNTVNFAALYGEDTAIERFATNLNGMLSKLNRHLYFPLEGYVQSIIDSAYFSLGVSAEKSQIMDLQEALKAVVTVKESLYANMQEQLAAFGLELEDVGRLLENKSMQANFGYLVEPLLRSYSEMSEDLGMAQAHLAKVRNGEGMTAHLLDASSQTAKAQAQAIQGTRRFQIQMLPDAAEIETQNVVTLLTDLKLLTAHQHELQTKLFSIVSNVFEGGAEGGEEDGQDGAEESSDDEHSAAAGFATQEDMEAVRAWRRNQSGNEWN